MKQKKIIILVVSLLGILGPTYAQWQKNIIDDDINSAVSVDVADMNGDEKPDLVVTNEGGDEIVLYLNNSLQWTKFIIDEYKSAFTFIGDMDGNDTMDIVASILYPRQIVWYENNHPTWTKHIIDESSDGNDFICLADFNNDGALDVVTAGGYIIGGNVVYYENNQPDWTKHIIEEGSGKYPCLNVNDIDGDGMLDVIGTMNIEDKVVWFKNEDNGNSWTKNTIDGNLDVAFGLNSYDIDGNDTIDVIATSRDMNDVVWYENHYPLWIKHVIDPNFTSANFPYAFDVDGNDTTDLIVTGFRGDSVVWYKNNHSVWTKQLIDPDLESARMPCAADIDGDSIKDIIVTAGNNIVWYKNPNTSVAYVSSTDVVPFSIQTQDDTIFVRASLNNPENHPVGVFAIIQGDQTQYLDTLNLYDDGLHNDFDPGDDIWSNIMFAPDLLEDLYNIYLITYDSTFGVILHPPTRIIKFGPISVKDYFFVDNNDTIFYPGASVQIKLNLINDGTTAIAKNVKANLVSLDPRITVSSYNSYFNDIPAGEISTSDRNFSINISSDCPKNLDLPIGINIYSFDTLCWSDTLIIEIQESPLGIAETKYPIARIYPNPTNNLVNIEFVNRGSGKVIIEIYNLTGQVILRKEYGGSKTYFTEQIDLSGYSNGLYLIRIRQTNEVYTKKFLLIK